MRNCGDASSLIYLGFTIDVDDLDITARGWQEFELCFISSYFFTLYAASRIVLSHASSFPISLIHAKFK